MSARYKTKTDNLDLADLPPGSTVQLQSGLLRLELTILDEKSSKAIVDETIHHSNPTTTTDSSTQPSKSEYIGVLLHVGIEGGTNYTEQAAVRRHMIVGDTWRYASRDASTMRSLQIVSPAKVTIQRSQDPLDLYRLSSGTCVEVRTAEGTLWLAALRRVTMKEEVVKRREVVVSTSIKDVQINGPVNCQQFLTIGEELTVGNYTSKTVVAFRLHV